MNDKGIRYRMDPTCRALCLGGMALAAVGLCLACAGREMIGIAAAAAGVLIVLLSMRLHAKRIAEKLIRRIRESGAEQDLKTSVPACFTLYRACPRKQVLAYIASLNPQAAAKIRAGVRK